jgi:hypothetical protein
VKRRRRLGVLGGPLFDATGTGRVGECGLRGEGGVTSECKIELNIALACSVETAMDKSGYITGSTRASRATNL